METNNTNEQPEGGQQQTSQSPQENPQEQKNDQAPEAQSAGQENNAQQQNVGSGNDVEDNKAITYLSYLGLLFLVPMLVKKDSPFAQFHAKQGLVLTIGWFIGSFLYALFGLGILVHIAILVLSIMGLVNVSKGETKDLPVVGDIAKKFNI